MGRPRDQHSPGLRVPRLEPKEDESNDRRSPPRSTGPGSVAPGFELVADDGKRVALSDFRGRKVVLYFYPKDMT
ncbi:MAG: redoxin domain-containing protein, partial [Anaerolineae bacterium]